MTKPFNARIFTAEARRLGGLQRKEAAKRELVQRILDGNPTKTAREAINRWSAEDGITAEQWAADHGIALPKARTNQYGKRKPDPGEKSTQGGDLERTCKEASRMLQEDGEDGRWVLVGLLAVAGRLRYQHDCRESVVAR